MALVLTIWVAAALPFAMMEPPETGTLKVTGTPASGLPLEPVTKTSKGDPYGGPRPVFVSAFTSCPWPARMLRMGLVAPPAELFTSILKTAFNEPTLAVTVIGPVAAGAVK